MPSAPERKDLQSRRPSQAWILFKRLWPTPAKYIDKLEMTQRRAARFMKNIPFRRSKPPVSVSAMVSDLGWESLQTRRLHSRLTMTYKITNGLVEVPQEYHTVPRPQNSARGHPIDNSSVSNLRLTHLSMSFFLGPFQPGMLFHKQLLRRTRLIHSSDMSGHMQFWPSASCTMYMVCTCSTAHSFFSGFNLRTCFRRCWSPWPRSHQ